MPEKKNQGAKTEATIANKNDPKTPVKKEEGNFLVLSCASDTITTGVKALVVNVAETQEKAVDYIKKLTSSRPEYLCVVEKKSLYSRKPQIVVKEITKNTP
ncbi:MAG: hypothetical protein M0T82_16630 [Desulfobacteraceae bacterium]|nr:hypothetical protein [Desulfobacteraceae bacterium]